jgi:hypothetical protein
MSPTSRNLQDPEEDQNGEKISSEFATSFLTEASAQALRVPHKEDAKKDENNAYDIGEHS